MKIAILGFGREGQSVFKFLKKTRALRGNELWILDNNPKTKIPTGVHSTLGKNYLKRLTGFDLIFRSPGIPYNLQELQRAKKSGVSISSATKLFFGALNHPPHFTINNPVIIGITGTKGKGTTATILYNILKQAGKNVFLAGNIGTPALDLIPRLSALRPRTSAFVILELSSFQLQDLNVSPPIAVVTDVFPDHQDSHKNLTEYYSAKANIARYQKKTDKIFFMVHNAKSHWIASKSKAKKIGVDVEKFSLFTPRDLKIKGEHNFKNATMAATVACYLNIPTKTIINTVRHFKGNEHRLEFVRKIMVRQTHHKNKSTIYFYNDSASTNPHTTAAAINAFHIPRSTIHAPIILIAGGQDKNLDYAPLNRALKNSNTKLVVLFGENKNKIAKAIKGHGSWVMGQVKIRLVKNLREAVRCAYHYAIRFPRKSAIVFSPGAASFDMFKNYADRGEQFKKLTNKIR